MISYKHLLILVTCLLLFGATPAQVQVRRLSAGEGTTDHNGFYYALPRSYIKVDVTVNKVENYRGPYSEFASRYLGLKNVVPSNAVEYKIRNVEMSLVTEPDPDQYYQVILPAKKSEKAKENLLRLSDCGLILWSDDNPPAGLSPAVTSVVEDKEQSQGQEEMFPEIFRYYADVSVFEKIDTIIRKLNFDTVTVERQFVKRTMVDKTPEQKAKEAADFISKIKENRFNLISGYQEVNYDKGTLEFMEGKARELENEYLKLFTGISITKTENHTYYYLPATSETDMAIPLFRISKTKGILDKESTQGTLVSVFVSKHGNTNEVAKFELNLRRSPDACGFYYRIPEYADVTVSAGTDFTIRERMLVPQLGIVSCLPVNRSNIQLSPSTGTLMKINIE